jgi:hypothetical protein
MYTELPEPFTRMDCPTLLLVATPSVEAEAAVVTGVLVAAFAARVVVVELELLELFDDEYESPHPAKARANTALRRTTVERFMSPLVMDTPVFY